jgi:DmsE family decaheme c-type cytochrome
MHSFVRTRSGALLLGAGAVCWLALVGLASAGPPKAKPAKAAAAAVSQNPQDYAGEATCLTCHEAQTKGYQGSPHGQKWNEKSPAGTKGCESCHGPGKAHADAGGDKTKINTLRTGDQAAAACTACHAGKTHALWEGSQHDQRNVSCISCHSVHNSKGPSQIKAANETALCATCHRPITNKQARFNHMPVREGKLSCSSCHNVHGSQNVKLLRTGTTTDEACSSCHADKRGPVLWEHAPVSENCTTCHDPHGSNNDRMLVAKQPFLCQRCHVTSRHPPTVYEGFLLKTSQNANKIYGRSCLACHQQIHGSNSPNGKAFLR